MKREVLLMFYCAFPLFLSAQKVEADSYDHGIHRVVTEWTDIEDNKDKRDFFLALLALDSDSIRYYLNFQNYSYADFKFTKGAKVLIKTFNGEIFTLYSEDSPITYSQFVDIFFVRTKRYYATTSYFCRRDILEKLVIDGVEKIRFEVINESFDKEYKKDKVGKYLKKAIVNVEKALNKKNLEDDF